MIKIWQKNIIKSLIFYFLQSTNTLVDAHRLDPIVQVSDSMLALPVQRYTTGSHCHGGAKLVINISVLGKC